MDLDKGSENIFLRASSLVWKMLKMGLMPLAQYY